MINSHLTVGVHQHNEAWREVVVSHLSHVLETMDPPWMTSARHFSFSSSSSLSTSHHSAAPSPSPSPSPPSPPPPRRPAPCRSRPRRSRPSRRPAPRRPAPPRPHCLTHHERAEWLALSRLRYLTNLTNSRVRSTHAFHKNRPFLVLWGADAQKART